MKETPDWFVDARAVSKSYEGRPALLGLSFGLPAGGFLGIFGPNGAGKTTLLKILATLTKPTSGTVFLAGWDLKRQSVEVRRQIGYVSHQTLLYGDLTAEENLRFAGRMYDIPSLDNRVSELLNTVGLSQRGTDRVRTFSRGMKQRLSIARALINHPSLLLLDEPDTGLDQAAEEVLGELLTDSHATGRTVVMVTHNLRYGFQVSDRFLFLAEGHLIHEMEKGSVSFEDFEAEYRRHTAVR